MDLGQLRTALQQRGYATDTATAQTELINSEYRKLIGMRRWWWLEVAANSTITCTIGTESYALSGVSDLLQVDAVRLESGTDYLELDYAQPQQFRTLAHADRDNGEPVLWTRVNNDLLLWPRPDKAYTVRLDYVKDPPDLANDADVPVLPAAYHDLLVWGAIRQLTFRERDTEGYGLANAEYSMLLNDMKHQDGLVQRQTPSEVIHTGIIDSVNEGLTTWRL